MARLFERIRPPEDFPSGFTQEQLTEQISKMGLPRSASLIVHSSLKALGAVQGGAQTLLDVLCGYLSRGLLVLPVCTYDTVSDEFDTFDPNVEPSCTGILGEVLLNSKDGAVRSIHPEYSLALWGRKAKSLASKELFSTSPCSRFGCMGSLTDNGGYILLAGTELDKCLHIFCAGEWLEPDIWLTEPQPRCVIDRKGRIIMYPVSRYSPEIIKQSKNFNKLRQPLIEMGAAVECRLGEADCLLCSCAQVISITTNLLHRRPGLFSDNRPVPKYLLNEVRRDEDALAKLRISHNNKS